MLQYADGRDGNTMHRNTYEERLASARDRRDAARKRVLAIADETTITVIALETAEILSTHLIEPTKTYWRNQQKSPGRWPGPSQ